VDKRETETSQTRKEKEGKKEGRKEGRNIEHNTYENPTLAGWSIHITLAFVFHE
jgi:hypothetical protein